MGIDHDVRLVYGWLISGSALHHWMQANGYEWDGEFFCHRDGSLLEDWPEGLRFVHASPYFDANFHDCVFAFSPLPRGDAYHSDCVTLEALNAIPPELLEAARAATLRIDPGNEEATNKGPKLWALPHIW
jgi:hypothetical protein